MAMLFERETLEAVLSRHLDGDALDAAIAELDAKARSGAVITEMDRAWARRHLADMGEGRARPTTRRQEHPEVVATIRPERRRLTEDQLWVAELLFGFTASDELEGDFMDQLLDQVTGMSDREWSMEELEATLSLLKERGLVDEQNRSEPSFQGGVARYVERLNAVVSLELVAFSDEELVEVGNRQSAALDHMAAMLNSTGRPVTSDGVGLYWLGSVRAGVGELVLCSRPLLPRFGSPSVRGLRLRAEDVQAVWLADTDLTWEDVDRRGEDPSPELLAELGVEVADGEARMGALRLPLGRGAE